MYAGVYIPGVSQELSQVVFITWVLLYIHVGQVGVHGHMIHGIAISWDFRKSPMDLGECVFFKNYIRESIPL